MKLGKHTVKVVRVNNNGAFLEDSKHQEVFMPEKEIDDLRIGDKLEVFVYDNGKNQRVASRKMPYIQIGQVKKLEVVAKTKFGYFVNVGLDKDVFLPFKEAMGRIMVNEKYLMMLYIDKSDRLCVTMQIERKLKRNENNRFKVNDIVKGTIYKIDNRGAHIAINDEYDGMILKRELKGIYVVGDVVEARVQRILKDDRITLTLREKAYKQMHYDADMLLELLQDNDGVLPLGDKTDSDIILEVTGLSKKAFKKAEGELYRKRLIDIYPEKIVLTK